MDKLLNVLFGPKLELAPGQFKRLPIARIYNAIHNWIVTH